uniref:UDP-glucose 4-epimerase n=1 Tax=Brugia timori TaxID=42155 RepID=A0A0R3QIM5_9BILA
LEPRHGRRDPRRRGCAELHQEHRHPRGVVRLGLDLLSRAARHAPHGAPRDRPRGRPLPRRPRPASRLVPLVAAAGLRARRPRSLQGPAHARLHRRCQGHQDEQVAQERHRSAGDQQQAGLGDHPPVGGRERLLGRHRGRRQDPRARGRRLPPHPQHAALPAGQHQRLRRREGRAAPVGAVRDRPLRARARRAVPGRDPRALQGVRVPPGGRQAADLLLGRPRRLLPRHPEGPPLHHRARLARAPQRADRAVAHRAGDAALDGAVPELHGRGGLEDRQHRPGRRLDLHPDLQPLRRTRRGAARQVEPHPRDPRRGEQGDRDGARRGPGRLLAAGQPA